MLGLSFKSYSSQSKQTIPISFSLSSINLYGSLLLCVNSTWRCDLSVPFRVMSSKVLWKNSCKLLLPLVPPIQRDPSTLNVGLALKPFVPTASPAPHILTLLLGLVPAVLAPWTPYSSSSSPLPHHHPFSLTPPFYIPFFFGFSWFFSPRLSSSFSKSKLGSSKGYFYRALIYFWGTRLS